MKTFTLNLMIIVCVFFSSLTLAHEGHTVHPHTHFAEYGVVAVVLFFVCAWVCREWFSGD